MQLPVVFEDLCYSVHDVVLAVPAEQTFSKVKACRLAGCDVLQSGRSLLTCLSKLLPSTLTQEATGASETCSRFLDKLLPDYLSQKKVSIVIIPGRKFDPSLL